MAAGLSAEPRPVAAAEIALYVDPPTHHLMQNRLFDRESNPYAGDDILAPYVAIRERMAAHGIRAHTLDAMPSQPDGRRNVVISFGTPDRLVPRSVRKYEALAKRPDIILSAFYAMECPIVEPTMYEALPAMAKLFKRVMSWSDTRALLPFTRSPVTVEHFCWPQSFDSVHEQLWAKDGRRFLLMMNANKLPRLYVDELYTARLRAVEFFHTFGDIDLYGRNWDRMPARVGKVRTPGTLRKLIAKAWPIKQRLWPNPMYVAAASATRGPARSKSKTLSEYRFALCFENSVLKGWMTEKLFDCFATGTVPVYWGAPDVLDYVPEACFIDMRKFKDFAELRAFLHALPAAAVQGYREAARGYLASPRFDPFRRRTFVEQLADNLTADTGVRL